MKNPFAQWTSDSSMNLKSDNRVKKNIRSYKVKKAVDFLSLPEIHNIDAHNIKVKFLKTRGLNEDEVEEAFNRLKQSQTPFVDLNQIANEAVHDQNNSVEIHKGQVNPLSTVFSFCNKLLLCAGIATSCFYLYQQWLSVKAKFDRSKKEDSNIKMELKQIKQEVLRMAADLRQYQSVQENQTKLLAEMNSLKAILTSRQYFEEKRATKFTMPSWQLNNTSTESSSTPPVTKEESVKINVQSTQMNGHVNGVEPKIVGESPKSNETVLTQAPSFEANVNPVLESPTKNDANNVENGTARDLVKESNVKLSSERKKETKKNDKKHNTKN